MHDYYETLNINADAGTMEIKKAYFAMLRKFPPEKEPEQFKLIRQAYDVLSNEEAKRQYDSVFCLPEQVRLLYQEGKEAYEEGSFNKAIKLLKRLSDAYPELTIIKALLGDVYLENENSGKAIKIFEKLYDNDKTNASYLNKLGDSYMTRGWTKKGIKAFEGSIAIDPDNISTWENLYYAYIHTNNFKLASDTVNTAIELGEKKGWDIGRLIELQLQHSFLSGDLNEFKNILSKYYDEIAAHQGTKDMICELLNMFAIGLAMYIPIEESSYIPALHEIFNIGLKLDEGNKKIKQAQAKLLVTWELKLLDDDPKVSNIIYDFLAIEINKMADLESVLDLNFSDTLESEFETAAIEIGIVDSIVESRKCILYVKEKYPNLYNVKKNFFDEVLNHKREDLLIAKTYKKLNYLKKKHPKELKMLINKAIEESKDNFDDDSSFINSQEPVKRTDPKISRNEPCPCGSGKKYKKCCGSKTK